MAAWRRRAARPVAVPARCRPGRHRRPAAAGQPGAAAHHAGPRAQRARRRCAPVPRAARRDYAVVVTGRRLRRGPTRPAHPDAPPNLKFGSRHVPGCPRSAVTLTTTIEPVDPRDRQSDDDAVTVTTNRPESVVKQHESLVVILDAGQQHIQTDARTLSEHR